MADELSFLDGEEPVDTATPAPEPVQEAPEAPQDGETAEPAAEPTPEPASEPAPAPTPDPGFVPLTAVLDEREKRQAAERRAQEMERRAQDLEAQRQAAPIPDPYEDPDGYRAFQTQQFQQAQLNIRLDLSEDLARGKHGDDLVTAAQQWALGRYEQSPAFRQEVLSHRNPYEFVVQQYQRDQFVSQVQPSDYEAFKAWQAAQAAAPQPAPAAQAAPPQPATIPRQSLAGAPSAGGVQTQVVEDPFEAEFSRKR
jgi:hypothetical protein